MENRVKQTLMIVAGRDAENNQLLIRENVVETLYLVDYHSRRVVLAKFEAPCNQNRRFVLQHGRVFPVGFRREDTFGSSSFILKTEQCKPVPFFCGARLQVVDDSADANSTA